MKHFKKQTFWKDIKVSDIYVSAKRCGQTIKFESLFDSEIKAEDLKPFDTITGYQYSCKGNVESETILTFFVDPEASIELSREEKRQLKEKLYNSLLFLSTERPDLYPRKRDSLATLTETFFYWASEYNDGYFSGMDNADEDKLCAYLTREYETY